jgi:hypothetical protein
MLTFLTANTAQFVVYLISGENQLQHSYRMMTSNTNNRRPPPPTNPPRLQPQQQQQQRQQQHGLTQQRYEQQQQTSNTHQHTRIPFEEWIKDKTCKICGIRGDHTARKCLSKCTGVKQAATSDIGSSATASALGKGKFSSLCCVTHTQDFVDHL